MWKLLVLILLFIGCNNPQKKTKAVSSAKRFSDTLEMKIDENHLFVPVVLNDTIKANFILDNMSYGTLSLDSTFLVEKRLMRIDTTLKDIRKKRINYINQLNIVHDRPIKFNSSTIQDTSRQNDIFDLKRIVGNKAQGLIGMPFLKKYLIEIDYMNNKIILHQPKFHKHKELLDTISIIPQDKQRMAFKVNITFNPSGGLPPFKENCFIDLGAGGNAISLSTRIVLKHKLLDIKTLSPRPSTGKVFSKEIVTGFTTKFKSIQLGKFRIDSPIINLNTSQKGMSATMPPMLGSYLFKRFGRIFIDFRNNAIYIPKK